MKNVFMKVILRTLLFSLCAMPLISVADVIGFEAGVNYWNYSISGDIRSRVTGSGNARLDYENDNDLTFFAVLEHPVPFLPNVKLQQNNISSDGTLRIRDTGIAPGSSVFLPSSIDLSHTDLMLYYEILDNWVNLDLGISAKYFDGYSRIIFDEQNNETSEFDDWIPMAYVKAQFDLPLTGLSAAATIEALSIGDNEVTDLDLALKYTSKLGLGTSVGYRMLDVDLETNNSFNGDLKADGFYLGLHLDF